MDDPLRARPGGKGAQLSRACVYRHAELLAIPLAATVPRSRTDRLVDNLPYKSAPCLGMCTRLILSGRATCAEITRAAHIRPDESWRSSNSRRAHVKSHS